VNSEVGYEANIADVSYSIKAFENLGFKVKFSGFNDKLFAFIEIFFKMLVETASRRIKTTTLKLIREQQTID
jgi:secreted Zn-dependent insulinase-like peptidase